MKETILCKDCEGKFLALMNELKREADKMHRCRILLDALDDLEIALSEGNINKIIARDRAYKNGNRIGRRIQRK